MKSLSRYTTVLLGASVLLWVAIYANASEHEHERAPLVKNEKWQADCGSCHVAYPPRMLSAASWISVMAGLDKHFGVNASLDTATAKEISTFLENNAGKGKYGASDKAILRISETSWFVREHRKIAANTWKNPKVKSSANCGACHTTAASGNYSEHNISIPK